MKPEKQKHNWLQLCTVLSFYTCLCIFCVNLWIPLFLMWMYLLYGDTMRLNGWVEGVRWYKKLMDPSQNS